MEDHLSTQQITHWHCVFNAFDRKSSGSVALDDLPELLKAIGESYDEKTLSDYAREVCSNFGRGLVSFSEFLAILKKVARERDEKAELKEAFRLYDKEGKGHIRASDFREILRHLDESQTEDDLDDLIAEFDADRSGTIDLEEFLNAMGKM